jgi:6-phosphogluconolactonase
MTMRSRSFQSILGASVLLLAGLSLPACADNDNDNDNGNGNGPGGGGGASSAGGGGGASSVEGGGGSGGGGDASSAGGGGGGGGGGCGQGALLCGDTCTVTAHDPNNCGACGNVCGANEQCSAGRCAAPQPPKAVYTMTNDPAGNRILSFARAADGSLSPAGTSTPTGGLGTGSGLGNQHGLIFDPAGNHFFAVNAGDNSVSMLSLEGDGSLKLLAHVPSGGVRPISVTASRDLVYVVNAGNAAQNAAATIAGFRVGGGGLTPIAGSTRPLSEADPAPAQIQFSPDGKVLVVTEKTTNKIDTYAVLADGAAGPPVVSASAGQTPFGFDFDAAQHLLVSEAQAGGANQSSSSSYALGADGALAALSPALATTRTAACWLVAAGGYAYVANAQTSDVTGFKIEADGRLSLLDADGVTAHTSGGATDEDVSDDNAFLYVVSNGAHVFSIYQINADGSLTQKPDFVGLPTAVSGIVAR